MKKLLIIFIAISITKSFASVNKLFLESVKSSKEVAIIHLSKKKSLSQLESTTSALFPSIDLVNTHKYANKGINSIENKDEIDSQTALSLQHKLFQGGAEFRIIDYKKLIPKQAQAQEAQSLSEYYGQFSSLYFLVSTNLKEKKTIEALLVNLRKRLEIVKKRSKIGRDRKADLYALESQLFRLEADLHNSNVQLKTSMAEFLNFSGLPKDIRIEDDGDPILLSLTKQVDLDERPELQNLKLNIENSLLAAKIEQSSNYPQVDIASNYYLDKYSSGRNDWDVSLNIRFNLVDFGKRSSSVQEKNIATKIDRLKYEYAKQNSKRTWSNVLDNFNSKKQELSTLKTSLKKIRLSYQQQLKDLKRGLVTQIEVIRTLDDVISLEKLVLKSALEVNLLYFQAQAYLGNIPKG